MWPETLAGVLHAEFGVAALKQGGGDERPGDPQVLHAEFGVAALKRPRRVGRLPRLREMLSSTPNSAWPH